MDFYHVLNRGVEKRDVVKNDKDRLRFLHDLFVFNNQNASPNYILHERHREHPRTLLVHIHAYCLMNNHYHLLLSPLIEDGISQFMKKLNMGYAKYFNEKYKRSGALWQGKYKKIPVQREAHFLYVPYYIHLNPLDYRYPEWREGKVHDVQKALAYLRTYRWSSHLDYSDYKNFPSLIERSLLQNVLGSQKRYENEICNIITTPRLAQESLSAEFKN